MTRNESINTFRTKLEQAPRAAESRAPVAPHPVLGYLLIAGATLFWAISAVMGKAAFAGRLFSGPLPAIDPLILAQTRTTIAVLVLAPSLLLLRGRGVVRISRSDLGHTLVLGVFGIAASNYTYYLSIQRTTVATAIILQYTAPIWVLVYLVARRLQRPTLPRVGSVALAVLGSALAIGLFGHAQFRPDSLGVLAGQAASFSFAFYTVFAGGIVRRNDRWTVLLYVLLGAALFWLVVNPPWRIVAQHYSLRQWEFLALFSLTSALVPFALYLSGLRLLDATRAIVTSCLEPVFSIVIAAFVLSERVTWLQTVGIIIVLGATIVVQLANGVRRRIAPELTQSSDAHHGIGVQVD